MANEFIVKHGLISNGNIAAATSELSGQSLSITDGAIIHGNFTVSGTTFTTQHETVEITDNLLVINDGEVGPGITVAGGLGGIEVDRGSSTNYRFVFDETHDNFRVGETGDLQAVASREDSPTTNGVPFWNNSTSSFDTDAGFLFSGEKLGIGTSPSYPLHLSYSPGDESISSFYLDMNPTGTHTTARYLYGISIDVDSSADGSTYNSQLRGMDINIWSTGTIKNLYGTNVQVNYNNTAAISALCGTYTSVNSFDGTIPYIYSQRNKVVLYTPASVSSAYVLYNEISMQSTSQTLGFAYGCHIAIGQSAGTITTGYLYHGAYSGTIGTKWGLYLTNETKNYFSGQVGIKETTPAADLDVDGTLILQNGTSINEFSTDTTLSGNSDDAVPTEKAVKTYVDDIHVVPSLYIKVSDTKAAGTQGGTFTQGAWRKRDINTEDNDVGGHCSISSNQITLAAGTYECRISAPAFHCLIHQTRLRNVTDGTTELLGTSEYASDTYNAYTRSFIKGRFTIIGSKTFEVQHRCSATQATNGFGAATNFGESEVYTIAEFWKVNAVTGATSEADATIGIVETGSYTGDGTTSHVINFQDSSITPKMIWVHLDIDSDANATPQGIFQWSAEMAPDRTLIHLGGGGHSTYTNRLIAATTGSFTVDDNGANSNPNTNGTKYDYIVVGIKTITAVATTVYEGYQSKASVYRVTAQSINTTTWTRINLDGEVFDGLNEFNNTSTYQFVPVADGYYQVSAGLSFNNMADGNRISISIYKTGVRQALVSTEVGGSGNMRIAISKLIYLTTSDNIQLYGEHNYGSARDIIAGISNSYMTIHRTS